ncbi:transmembrane protein 131 isoform X1 [Dermacentor variabilis]|uniref:transmembrane protein 131 isoform X1 n=1 Tax=Dermacentor variabilis TaxID=34621 RepID=UPI003F5B4F56
MARLNVIRSCGNMKLHKFLLFFHVLDIVYKVVQSVDGHAQGFVEAGSDINGLVDGVLAQISEPSAVSSSSPVSFADLEDSSTNMYASPIAFEPAFMDFKSQPLSMPVRRRVVVKNLSPESSIEMLSISGNTANFHCSFFQEKRISPGGNTTFDIVYLGRERGLVENILFIHTSLGSFKYQVSAFGKENPYRLRPFVGVRMPLNSSYTPLIYMHNPHSSTIQLTEIYSSGGDLHLEMPDGENKISKELWEIPPYKTKPVMKANFVSRIEKNHTAFIRIKLNSTNHVDLILPVEVEVVSLPGIFSPMETLDFGVMHSQDEPRTLPLNLLNSGPKQLYITNVIVTPVNEAVEVKFTPTKVPPDTVRSTQVATVTYIPSKVKHLKQCSGKIVVKSKNNQYKLTIPFQVYFMNGSLEYNVNGTVFYIGRAKSLSKSDVRPLNISNTFPVPVVIHSIELQPESQPHFTVIFNSSTVLQPNETKPVVFLKFHPQKTALQLNATLRLHTNISHFNIPLTCYSGRLTLRLHHAVNNESFLDFGTLGIGNKRSMFFVVINENPIEVVIKHWGTNMTKTLVELATEAENSSTLVGNYNFSSVVRKITLLPLHYALFRISVTAPETEGVFWGEASIETNHELLKVQFTMRTAKGSLMSDPIVFENAFPGKVSSQNLYIHSTFSHSMTVTSVQTVPEDSRFFFEVTQNASPVLQPRSKNWAGKLYFDPRRECKQECYSGLPTATTEGHQWLSGLNLPSDVGDADLELFQSIHGRWLALQESRRHVANVTLKVDTSEAQGFLMEAQVLFHWPKLSTKNVLKFPVTQVGNLTVRQLTLENPSSLPVLVQVLPLFLYPDLDAALTMAAHSTGMLNLSAALKSEPSAFSLQDLEEYNPSPDNVFLAYGKGLEEYFHVQTHRKSLAFQLTPGMRVRVKVGFSPKDDQPASSLLLIRNNLTVVSAVMLKGQGGYGQLRLGNKVPGGDAVLTFELSESHLKDCDGTRNMRLSQPNFTVRRGFTARNTGQLPVFVQGFYISGKPCQGYGFRVLDCHGFELKPNATRRIDIAFTPDFMLSLVEHTLELQTSLGPGRVAYKMSATVPRQYLGLCQASLPRPRWEPFMQCCALSAAIFLLLCALAYAYLERDRILHTSFYPLTTLTDQGAVAHPTGRLQAFDLRSLATSPPGSQGVAADSQCLSQSYSRAASSCSSKRKSHDMQQQHTGPCRVDTSCQVSTSRSSMSLSRSPDSEHHPTRDPDTDRGGNRNGVRRRTNARQKQETGVQASLPSMRSESPVRPKQAMASSVLVKKAVDERQLVAWWKFITWFGSEAWSRERSVEAVASVATQTAGDKQVLVGEKKEDDRKSRRKKMVIEEETSSTTTETSNADSDLSEKDHTLLHLPDVCTSAKLMKGKRPKLKGCPEPGSSRILAEASNPSPFGTPLFASDANLVDESFEASAKPKMHKKTKIERKKAHDEEIIRPSTLELPYKPKTSIETKEPHVPQPEVLRLSTELRKSAEIKMKARSSSFESEPDLHLRRSSPPPLWDSPKEARCAPDDALAEIARQTENFALQQKSTRMSRPLSYSAAVAGSSSARPSRAPGSPPRPPAPPTSRSPGVVGQKPAGLAVEPPLKTKSAPLGHSWDAMSRALPDFPIDTFSLADKPKEPWPEPSDSKQEIAPVLRNMCASFSPGNLRTSSAYCVPSPEATYSPWSTPRPTPGEFASPWQGAGSSNSTVGVVTKSQWGASDVRTPTMHSEPDRWAPSPPQRPIGCSDTTPPLWEPAPTPPAPAAALPSVWGSSWWSSTSVTLPSGTPRSPGSLPQGDTSPTESMTNMVSSIGLDSPDASLEPAASFEHLNPTSLGTPLSHSIWTQQQPTGISHPWNYSLFQDSATTPVGHPPVGSSNGNSSNAIKSPHAPLGWQDKESF